MGRNNGLGWILMATDERQNWGAWAALNGPSLQLRGKGSCGQKKDRETQIG